jgi:hypothetical protein
MATTNVATGSNLAITQQSVALTAQITRAPGNLNALTGPAPKQSDAEAMLKMQTSAEMPFVRVTDLSTDPKGDKVTVDAFNVVTGKPIMARSSPAAASTARSTWPPSTWTPAAR